jgi:hypothetical protein
MPSTDKSLPENAKENLDRKLDHAIKETFPTSDPVSVTITKGGAIDYDSDHATSPANDPPVQEGQTRADNLLRQTKETVSGVAGVASEAARDAFNQGRRYADAARRRYPEAERYYREGLGTVRHQASDNPFLTLLIGFGLGYALAWVIHTGRSDRREGVPDYARTKRRYAADRSQPRA